MVNLPRPANKRGPFALRGDSGSLVIAENDGAPLGLVIAVDGSKGRTYVYKATHIERLLNVSFLPPRDYKMGIPGIDASSLPTDAKAPFDVLVGGISIGHPLVSAGTLGCFVWDRDSGEVLGLTCAHVAAPPGAKVVDPIYQPGPLDIRQHLRREPLTIDVAGHLLRWEKISTSHPNLMDAAVFRPVRPVWANYTLFMGERVLAPCGSVR